MALGTWVYRQLDPNAYEGEGFSPLNKVIMAAIILAIALTIVETEARLVELWSGFFIVANLTFAAFFTLEYLARVLVAGQDPRYGGFLGRLRFVLTPAMLCDALALAPYLLLLSAEGAAAFRLVRLLRLIALARFGRFSSALRSVLQVLCARRYELYVAFTLMGLVILVSASCLYLAEGAAQPEEFGSIPRALWTSVASLTPLSPGSAIPVTTLGRLASAVTALAAIGLVAMPAGILAGAFSEALQRSRAREEDGA
jgi:voltage-gated potassium channel